jgi:hypothetical protein
MCVIGVKREFGRMGRIHGARRMYVLAAGANPKNPAKGTQVFLNPAGASLRATLAPLGVSIHLS